MDESDYDWQLNELDRLLNDPNSNLDPEKVWSLLAEISRKDSVPTATAASQRAALSPTIAAG